MVSLVRTVYIQSERVGVYNCKDTKRHLMAKIGHQKIGQLIAEMGHYDPDNMEMAAKRLSELIISGEVVLEGDQKTANSIREAFMKQIESQNDTVQSEAIKYLADIVPKLPSEQVEEIFKKILEHITNLNETEKKRERYGACAATVIHQAAEENGRKLENLFIKSVENLLAFKDKKTELEIILINIITEFVRKWPNVTTHLTYDRKGLILYLLKNIQFKSKLDIIKKSQTCLGKVAMILDRDMINVALNDGEWGLLRFIVKNHTRPTLDNLKHARNGLLCLAQIIKTHNIELRFWSKDIAHMLLAVINQFKSHDDIDNIEVVCDILDASLTSLAYLVRTFSRELRDQLQSREINPYSSFLKELIDFNVEGMMGYAGEEMECEEYGEDEEYYEEAEVDEKCWKVRRSALFYISFLARHDTPFLKSLKEGDLIRDLGAKLVEEHSMVSEMAFFTFNELIELISIDRAFTNDELEVEDLSLLRVKSSAREIADLLIKEIESRIRVILHNSKFNDQLKIEASKILLRIVQIYNTTLIGNQQDTFQLVGFLNEEMTKTGLSECKANLLQCLKQLVSDNYPFAQYSHILDLYFDSITKNQSIKIQSICLLSIKKFLDLFHNDISQQPAVLDRAIALVKSKIKELDGDKLIKQATCKCLTELFRHYQLSNSDLAFFFDCLSQKLKIEVEKLYLIETLNALRNTVPLAADSGKALEGVIRQISDNLGSINFQLNIKSIQAIDNLLAVLGKGCNLKLLEELLDKSKIILGEGKIPSFLRHIAGNHPKLLKPYAELIIKSTESEYISVLLKEKVIDISSCLKIFKGLDQQKSKKISQTLGAINFDEALMMKEVDESPWGRVMVGALGYAGNAVTLKTLYSFLVSFKSDESKSDVCSAIGNILSRNPDELLPSFLQKADSSTDRYTHILIIKEMLSFRQQPFEYLPILIEWLFQRSEGKLEVESNYYITSQCVGKLAFLHPEAVKKVLNNAKAENSNRRLIVASSLRFGLDNLASLPEDSLAEYIHVTGVLMSDEKVSVREGAVKSMSSVAQFYSRGVKHESTEHWYWQSIIKNSKIDDKLIVVIDYGLCKQIRDQGKSLRLQSFNLLQLLAKRVHLETALIEELMEMCLHRIGEETSNDIVLKRLTLLKTLTSIQFTPFIRLQDQFIAKVGPREGLLKKYEKGGKEERTQVYLKGILREITEIAALGREESVDKLGAMEAQLKNSQFFGPLMVQ